MVPDRRASRSGPTGLAAASTEGRRPVGVGAAAAHLTWWSRLNLEHVRKPIHQRTVVRHCEGHPADHACTRRPTMLEIALTSAWIELSASRSR